MWLWSIHSRSQWIKNYENRPRDTKVIVENKVAPFFPDMMWFGTTNTLVPLRQDPRKYSPNIMQGTSFPQEWWNQISSGRAE